MADVNWSLDYTGNLQQQWKRINIWEDCNLLCEISVATQIFILISHFLLNLGALRGGAGGNILLVTNTSYTTIMTLASVATIIGLPEWMMAPYRTRLSIFIFACISTTVFTSSLLGTLIAFYKNGMQISIANMVSFYSVYLQLGSFIPSTFIFFFESLS